MIKWITYKLPYGSCNAVIREGISKLRESIPAEAPEFDPALLVRIPLDIEHLVDWSDGRHYNYGKHSSCSHCGRLTFLLDDAGRTAHKFCTEAALAQLPQKTEGPAPRRLDNGEVIGDWVEQGLYGYWIEPAPSLLDDPSYIKRRDELRAWLAGNGPQPKPIPITRLHDNPATYCSTCGAELWFRPSQTRGICEKCWRQQQVTT